MTDPVELTCLRGSERPRLRVLLLHGLANSAAIWRPLADGWPEDIELWAADLPWRGGADTSWSWQPNCTQWIDEAMARVPGGVDVLVAHSMSASVVLELLSAAGSACTLDGVVLVAPFYRARPEEFEWPAVRRSIENFERTITEGIRVHAGARIDESKIAELGELVCRKVGPYGWSRFFTMYLNTPWLRTHEIQVPVRVLVGGQDETAREQDGIQLADALPAGSVHRIAASGHFPMIESPEEFRAAVREFLEQCGHDTPQTVACGVN